MPPICVTVDCPVHSSSRVRQLARMFDLTLPRRAREHFSVQVPGLDEAWEVGVIVGPSGSGKTTIARAAFGEVYRGSTWRGGRAVIDEFGDLPIDAIARALTAVGFSSPPAWTKPFEVLSNGEKFRCELARALLAATPLVVFDEFTSVVDRTVAKISAAAVSKAVRAGTLADRFVAVACHYDVVEWLEPDWVLDMGHAGVPTLARGRLRRPQVCLEITRASAAMWPRFSRHHYLNGRLHPAARCFVATVEGRPAAFTAVLPFPHPIRPGWREHRTVCLPDFQGIGIGNAHSEFVASLFAASGRPYFSTTSHPAMIHHRSGSPLWRTLRRLSRVPPAGRTSRTPGMARNCSTTRNTASFEYIGPSRPDEARSFGLGAKGRFTTRNAEALTV